MPRRAILQAASGGLLLALAVPPACAGDLPSVRPSLHLRPAVGQAVRGMPCPEATGGACWLVFDHQLPFRGELIGTVTAETSDDLRGGGGSDARAVTFQGAPWWAGVTWQVEDERGERSASVELKTPLPAAAGDGLLREGVLSSVGFALETLAPGRHVLSAQLVVPLGDAGETYTVRAPAVTLLVADSAAPAASARVETARQAAVARKALRHGDFASYERYMLGYLAEHPSRAGWERLADASIGHVAPATTASYYRRALVELDRHAGGTEGPSADERGRARRELETFLRLQPLLEADPDLKLRILQPAPNKRWAIMGPGVARTFHVVDEELLAALR